MRRKTTHYSWNLGSWPLPLITSVLLLSFIGIIFVFESSSIRALQETENSFYYLRLQLRWFFLGYSVLILTSFIPYKMLKLVAIPALVGILILLVAVLLPGIGQKIGGARRWIDLGFITIQPTEFAKLATILYLATWFTGKERKRFIPFLGFVGSLMMLILLQPDMGTAIIIFALSISLYFLAGQELRNLFLLLPVAIVVSIALIFIAPYRLQRLTAYLDPSKDPQGIGYHIQQINISLTEGGLFGRGFGASRQKYLYLPEAHTDSIFAIYSEEMGFAGGVFLIGLYTFFLLQIYRIYVFTDDRFAQLLAGGIFAFFGCQIMVNLGAMAGLLPLTGVPLPFISYGGSHLLTSCILIGILISIWRSTKGGVRSV